jgi:hypothetical protein
MSPDGLRHRPDRQPVSRTGRGGDVLHVPGGASTIQQAVAAGVQFLHVAPVILNGGIRLFERPGGPIRLDRAEVIESRHVTYPRVVREDRFRIQRSAGGNPGKLLGRWPQDKVAAIYYSAWRPPVEALTDSNAGVQRRSLTKRNQFKDFGASTLSALTIPSSQR